jgi:hypothetical protein
MNAVMTYAGARDPLQRYDVVRRKNAEAAYDRHARYNGENQKVLKELDALLTGDSGPATTRSDRQPLQTLDAGQVKQVTFPVGKTLEETIDLWRGVRADALSVPEPSTADYQLAATASAKIMQTEAQIALEKRAQSEVEAELFHEELQTASVASEDLPSLDREVLLLQKQYDQAISSYSFHVQMKRNGFEIERPSFYKIA